jgi:hypothetical protein
MPRHCYRDTNTVLSCLVVGTIIILICIYKSIYRWQVVITDVHIHNGPKVSFPSCNSVILQHEHSSVSKINVWILHSKYLYPLSLDYAFKEIAELGSTCLVNSKNKNCCVKFWICLENCHFA